SCQRLHRHAAQESGGENERRAVEPGEGTGKGVRLLLLDTRKGRLSTDEARNRIEDWQALFPVVAAGANTLSHAIDGLRRFQMPFWDAMLWATVQEAGVSVLLTDELQD